MSEQQFQHLNFEELVEWFSANYEAKQSFETHVNYALRIEDHLSRHRLWECDEATPHEVSLGFGFRRLQQFLE